MNNVDKAGAAELADLMRQFSEAVLKSDLSQDVKNEVLEQVDYVAADILVLEDKRKRSIVKSIMGNVGVTVSSVNELYTLWTNIEKIISQIG